MSNRQTIQVKKSVPVLAEVDVLVVGSGIAGSTAAVTAARTTKAIARDIVLNCMMLPPCA